MDKFLTTRHPRHTYSITVGDGSESRVGCEIVRCGERLDAGMTTDELAACKQQLEAAGVQCELISLNQAAGVTGLPAASVLIGRNAVGRLCDTDALHDEIDSKRLDTKMLAYGRVCNRHAHYTCLFAPERFENLQPDYTKGEGYIHSTDAMPQLSAALAKLPEWLGPKFANRSAELNKYFAPSCSIGWHGDTERRICFCMRLGKTLPLYFQAFDPTGHPFGKRVEMRLNHGDVYLMSDHAVGYNWRDRANRWRHAAGHVNGGRKRARVDRL